MKQALCIFRKDVHHLWPAILVVILLTVVHAIFEVRGSPVNVPETARVNSIANLLTMLLPLGLWFLVAQAVYQETLPGDRQFWLTRPYRWTSLLASKILFAVVFISIPLFFSDCYILGIQGFPVVGVFPDLLLRFLAVAAVFILPAFAIATITTGLPQFVLAIFILLLAQIAESLLSGSGRSIDISGALLLVAIAVILAAIVIWQYTKRRTSAARIFLLAGTLGFFPGISATSAFIAHHTTPNTLPTAPNGYEVDIGYDSGRVPALGLAHQYVPGEVLADIPLAVIGLPPGTLLRGRAELTFDVAAKTWPPGGYLSGWIERQRNEYWLKINLEKPWLAELKGKLATVHAHFIVEIVTDEIRATIPVSEPSFTAPDLGLCHLIAGPPRASLECRSGLSQTVETTVLLDSPGTAPVNLGEVMPHSLPMGLTPTTQTINVSAELNSGSRLCLIPRQKLTEFQRTVNLPAVDLSKYILPSQPTVP
jgi:hypothetical protein